MNHFGKQWVFVGLLLVIGFLGLRWMNSSEAQGQDKSVKEINQEIAELIAHRKALQDREEAVAKQLRILEDSRQRAELRKARTEENEENKPAPLPQRHFLEKGKSYFFVWQENFGPAVVLEEPRDGWVKVQTSYDTQWLNLSTVHRVRPAPEAKEKKDAEKPKEAAGQAAQRDVERLQGRWVAETVGGNELPKGHQLQLRFEGEKVVWTQSQSRRDDIVNASVSKFTFKVSPPSCLDLTATEGELKGWVSQSIYALVGDTLTICHGLPGEARPTDFTSPPNPRHYLVVLKREKAR